MTRLIRRLIKQKHILSAEGYYGISPVNIYLALISTWLHLHTDSFQSDQLTALVLWALEDVNGFQWAALIELITDQQAANPISVIKSMVWTCTKNTWRELRNQGFCWYHQLLAGNIRKNKPADQPWAPLWCHLLTVFVFLYSTKRESSINQRAQAENYSNITLITVVVEHQGSTLWAFHSHLQLKVDLT